MIKPFTAFLLFSTSILPLLIYSQDASFTQFYANPLYLNPALSGSTECGRLHLNYRNQWPSLDNAFVTYSIAYDQNLPSINSGFGVMVMNDQQGNGSFNRTMAGGFYSYHLSVSEELSVFFGMKASFYQESINWSKLIFADMINPATGEIYSTGSGEAQPDNTSIAVADFGAGIVLGYSDKMFFGFAADHLSQPQLNFYTNSDNQLNMKFTAHGGLNFNASNGSMGDMSERDLIIQPNLLYLQQADFKQLNLGIYVSKAPFITGAWFRHSFQNADALVVLLGLSHNNFRFGYSYDYTVSQLAGRSGGAHELSIAWQFCVYTNQKRVIRTIKSPVF